MVLLYLEKFDIEHLSGRGRRAKSKTVVLAGAKVRGGLHGGLKRRRTGSSSSSSPVQEKRLAGTHLADPEPGVGAET